MDRRSSSINVTDDDDNDDNDDRDYDSDGNAIDRYPRIIQTSQVYFIAILSFTMTAIHAYHK
jgi:hypothetical protein